MKSNICELNRDLTCLEAVLVEVEKVTQYNGLEDKKALEDKSITIKAKGSQAKLFGAITSKEIAEALEKESGLSIDKKKISVANIKTYGAYTAEVKLYPEIAAKVTVNIVPEE